MWHNAFIHAFSKVAKESNFRTRVLEIYCDIYARICTRNFSGAISFRVVYRYPVAMRFYASRTLHLTWKFLRYTRKVLFYYGNTRNWPIASLFIAERLFFPSSLNICSAFLCPLPILQRSGKYFQCVLLHQGGCCLFNVKAAPSQQLLIFLFITDTLLYTSDISRINDLMQSFL